MPNFNRTMGKLKSLSEAAWEETRQYPPGMWSMAGYSSHTCCDLQANNMYEAFNSSIIELREQIVISLIKGLKFYMTDESIISVFNIIFESILFIFDFVLFNIVSFLELFYFKCKLFNFRNKYSKY